MSGAFQLPAESDATPLTRDLMQRLRPLVFVLPEPNGERERHWTKDQCEEFMQDWLTKAKTRRKRIWDYDVWLELQQRHAEGIPWQAVMAELNDKFPVLKQPGAQLNKRRYQMILHYRRDQKWAICERYRALHLKERFDDFEIRRKHYAKQAQQTEFSTVELLTEQVRLLTSQLGLAEFTDDDYDKVLNRLERVMKLLGKYSGTDALRNYELHSAKAKSSAEIRAEYGQPADGPITDGRGIIPQFHDSTNKQQDDKAGS